MTFTIVGVWPTGDLCDDDIDGDGIDNSDDNCPYVSNGGQVDTNGQYRLMVNLIDW